MAAFQGWATAVLRAVGAPITKENLRFVQAWQRAEGGGASFNPLNTTQQWKNASSYNSVGVRNYTSAADGVAATAHTLLNGYYPKIVAGLRSGKLSAPQLASMTDELGKWGTGSGVLRVLNSGPVDVPHVGAPAAKAEAPSPEALTQQFAPDAYRHQAAAQLLQSSLALAQGGSPGDFASGILGMAQQRQALMAAHQTFGEAKPAPSYAPPHTATQPAAPASSGKAPAGLIVAPDTSLHGVNPQLVSSVAALARYLGKPIEVVSGYRDRTEQAVLYQRYLHGGNIAAKPGTSNHERGQAMDLTINGVPISQAVPASLLAKFGLHNPVSGDYPHTTLIGVNG